MLSKSGFSGLHNNNLRRIDIQMRAMYFQCESIKKDCFDEQWAILDQWWSFAFVMMFAVTPGMLIFSEENGPIDMRILLAPTTLAWCMLLAAYCFVRARAKQYFNKVTSLMQTNANFRNNKILAKMGRSYGRITKHCQNYKVEEFQVRFLNNLILIAFLLYVGVFLKVYLFDSLKSLEMEEGSFFDKLRGYYSWTVAVSISFIPVVLIYVVEIIKESLRS